MEEEKKREGELDSYSSSMDSSSSEQESSSIQSLNNNQGPFINFEGEIIGQ